MTKKIIIAVVLAACPIFVSYEMTSRVGLKEKSVFELAMPLIKENEGFRFEAYEDGGRYSIGYGTKSHKGERICRHEAERRFLAYVCAMKRRIAWIDSLDAPKGVKIALIDLCYNRGSIPKAFKRAAKSGDYDKLAELFLQLPAKGGVRARRERAVKMILNF